MEEKVNKIKNQILMLSCPLIQRCDDWFVLEVLTKPGEYRTKILYWLFESFLDDLPKIDLSLKEKSVSKRSRQPKDSGNLLEKNELLLWATSLGLCEETDLDVIEGSAPLDKQLPFLTLLLDLVVTKKAVQEASLQDESFDFDAVLASQRRLTEIIAENQWLHPEKWNDTNLLPPDIEKEINERKDTKRLTRISISELESELIDVDKEFEEKKKLLGLLMETALPPYDTACQEPSLRLIAHLDELNSKCQTFADNFKMYKNIRPKPDSHQESSIGSLAEEAIDRQSKLVKSLQDLETMKTSLQSLCQETTPSIESLSKQSVPSSPIESLSKKGTASSMLGALTKHLF